MPTIALRTIDSCTTATPTALPANTNDLGPFIYAMCNGDYEAAEIVTQHLRPALLDEVRAVLDAQESEAEDVVDELLADMIDEGIDFPKTTSPVKRLLGMARARARKHLRDTAWEWNEASNRTTDEESSENPTESGS